MGRSTGDLDMTEMVHGPVPVEVRDPLLPRWWRTVDRWTMASVLFLFIFGMILALAASPPLAQRNGLPGFYYVERQAVFGGLSLMVMIITSMLSPTTIRRLATIAFGMAFVSLAFLPLFGTDFGKGATRWYSLGFASIQPSEFIKPAFVVFAAWLISASFEINGPPGRLISFAVAMVIAVFLVLQPDFGQASLIVFAWGVMYFCAGAPLLLIISMAGITILCGKCYQRRGFIRGRCR
jgi:cell division protein FtsW